MEKSPDAFRTISEVSKWLDTPTHVLRFWESRFPQVAPVQRAGGRRYYRPEDMQLLGGIKEMLHVRGQSIREVQQILAESGSAAVTALSPPLAREAATVPPAPRLTFAAAADDTEPTPAASPAPPEDSPGDFAAAYAAVSADEDMPQSAGPEQDGAASEDPDTLAAAEDADAQPEGHPPSAEPPSPGGPADAAASQPAAEMPVEGVSGRSATAHADGRPAPRPSPDHESESSAETAEEDELPSPEDGDAPDPTAAGDGMAPLAPFSQEHDLAPAGATLAAAGDLDETGPVDPETDEPVGDDGPVFAHRRSQGEDPAQGEDGPGDDNPTDAAPDTGSPGKAGSMEDTVSQPLFARRWQRSAAASAPVQFPAAEEGGFRSRRAAPPQDRPRIQGFFINELDQDMRPPPATSAERDETGPGTGFSALDSRSAEAPAGAIPAAPAAGARPVLPRDPSDPAPGAACLPSAASGLRGLESALLRARLGEEALARQAQRLAALRDRMQAA
ncbi:MerR family transcriptional regulator [Mangrovicoccus algicola]|uniref:MerR family transcriptional regulator n=1 Tax=Mangrovicoccus algicola TaxID=2771008 RepID=UPI001D001E47|nr:MerR family transcriptional regulator [Mangrovicoccus algicola]